MQDTTPAPVPLTPGAQQLVHSATSALPEGKVMCTHHWLLALLDRHGPMVESLVYGVTAVDLRRKVVQQIDEGNTGVPLDEPTLIQRALEAARKRGKAQASERDVATAVLQAASFKVKADAPADAAPAQRKAVPVAEPAAAADAVASAQTLAPAYAPRPTKETPTLDKFGRDLTRQALEGRLVPMVGRDDEIRLVVETMCRRTKPNPVLIGPAGVGKTAIVEGLAQLVVRNQVPATLQGVRIVEIQPSSLVAGASMMGEIEKRMTAILEEASQPGIVLFIDEVHSMVGAGGHAGSGDVASLLKPALARGQLVCVAATTEDEYRRYIEPDTALERRFQPVPVRELTPEQTLPVMKSLRDLLKRERNVQVGDSTLQWLVDFAGQFLHNRHFPDKAVDLLDQCVAYAVANGKANVRKADAQEVAQRLVGMPLALDERLSALRQALCERGVLTDEDTQTLLNRLSVTLRGIDLRSPRPNAVILLAGPAAATADAVCETIAACLFGAANRIVTIDFGTMTEAHDVTTLIGSPPGYVGYDEDRPLLHVAKMPWCVVRCDRVDFCHPLVRAILRQGLDAGFIPDARGRRIHLSDAVVVMTAGTDLREYTAMGFRHADAAGAGSMRGAAEAAVGPELAAQCDLITAQIPVAAEEPRQWLKAHLETDLAARYRKQGLEVAWDETAVEWILKHGGSGASQSVWEGLVDGRITPLLLPHMEVKGAHAAVRLTVRCENDSLVVEKTRRQN